MKRDELEMEIYSNLMELENNGSRKQLSKIEPFEDKEIADVNIEYDQLSEISTKLFAMNKPGIEYKDSLLQDETGFDEIIKKQYGDEDMMNARYNELNQLQKFTVDSICKLIDKNEPFFANCQGGGGTGKSFIIK